MLVMKFGGASVAAPENFAQVAKIIIDRRKEQSEVVVVVSAMAHATDQLLSLAKSVHPDPPKRELDMLVSVGERVSIALLAMALAKEGVEAVSFTGSQSGILTCVSHTEAKIVDVRPKRIVEALGRGKVVIVAGFQGMSVQGDITTLGRGGSDTSAIALAIALGADVEFYKDVAGIFAEDPKKCPEALLLPYLTYEEALVLAHKGAKVLHARSLSLAQANGIPIQVRSFHTPLVIGSRVGGKERSAKQVYEG